MIIPTEVRECDRLSKFEFSYLKSSLIASLHFYENQISWLCKRMFENMGDPSEIFISLQIATLAETLR